MDFLCVLKPLYSNSSPIGSLAHVAFSPPKACFGNWVTPSYHEGLVAHGNISWVHFSLVPAVTDKTGGLTWPKVYVGFNTIKSKLLLLLHRRPNTVVVSQVVCNHQCVNTDSSPQSLSLHTSLSIIPSLMTLIRLFPLINLSLIERVFVCVRGLWVLACDVRCCQRGMIIRLLIPLILMLCESLRENEMSGRVWCSSCCHWATITIHLQLSGRREDKWSPLHSTNNLQTSEVVLCDAFLSFLLAVYFVYFLRPCTPQSRKRDNVSAYWLSVFIL